MTGAVTARGENTSKKYARSLSRATNSKPTDADPYATQLSLWQQLTTCQVKRDRVILFAVRFLRLRSVSDVRT